MTPRFASSLLVAGSLALVTAMAPVPASAVDLPCSTAKLIVPWGAGGDTDVLFRFFTDLANKKGAKPQLQVVNITGQGGNKGAKEAKESKPDGCTVFGIHQSAITSYLTGRVDFTWDAFEPVALLLRTPSIIGAHPAVPYNNAVEMVKYAKAHPGEILAGVTLGSTSHFFFLLIEDAANVKFKYISYEGTRERMTALLANNINMGEINLLAANQYIKTNELKALGVSAAKPYAEFPEIKTLASQGIDVVYGTDRGIVLPKGTPKAVVDYYIDLAKKVSADPEFAKAAADNGSTVEFTPGAEYRDYFQKTFDKWEKIAKSVGVYKR